MQVPCVAAKGREGGRAGGGWAQAAGRARDAICGAKRWPRKTVGAQNGCKGAGGEAGAQQ